MILNDPVLENDVNVLMAVTGMNKADFYADVIGRATAPFRDENGKIATKVASYQTGNPDVPEVHKCLIIREKTIYRQPYTEIYDLGEQKLKSVPSQNIIKVSD